MIKLLHNKVKKIKLPKRLYGSLSNDIKLESKEIDFDFMSVNRARLEVLIKKADFKQGEYLFGDDISLNEKSMHLLIDTVSDVQALSRQITVLPSTKGQVKHSRILLQKL